MNFYAAFLTAITIGMVLVTFITMVGFLFG